MTQLLFSQQGQTLHYMSTLGHSVGHSVGHGVGHSVAGHTVGMESRLETKTNTTISISSISRFQPPSAERISSTLALPTLQTALYVGRSAVLRMCVFVAWLLCVETLGRAPELQSEQFVFQSAYFEFQSEECEFQSADFEFQSANFEFQSREFEFQRACGNLPSNGERVLLMHRGWHLATRAHGGV